MAIISAGVIMNVIFAFLMAIAAYSIGVKDIACGVSGVLPGNAAWKANLQPGDMFIDINHSGRRELSFRDLTNAVALSDLSKGIDFLVQRPGVEEPFWVNLRADLSASRLLPTIGVVSPRTSNLAEKPVYAGTAAAKPKAFRGNDKIVAVNDQAITTYAELDTQFAHHPDTPLRITVEHRKPVNKNASVEEKKAAAEQPPERLEIEVPPQPMRTLGLQMQLGAITAVQADSPAEKEGLREGDVITAIDGQNPGDPMRLADRLRRRAGEEVTLSIAPPTSGGQNETLEKKIKLREPKWIEEPQFSGNPAGIEALGVSCAVTNFIAATEEGSPAANATLAGGTTGQANRFAAGDEIMPHRASSCPSSRKAQNRRTTTRANRSPNLNSRRRSSSTPRSRTGRSSRCSCSDCPRVRRSRSRSRTAAAPRSKRPTPAIGSTPIAASSTRRYWSN